MAVDGISLVDTLVGMAAVAVGALTQGSIGFGFGLIVVPALGLMRPDAVPATVLLIALPMTAWLSLRERGDIDQAGFAVITAGRLVGTLGGVWLLVTVARDSLTVLTGVVVVVAVGLSWLAPDFEAGRPSRLAAGVASGVMTTIAAIGGPPLALVYSDHPRPGAELRSTLNLAFLVGALLSLGGLLFAGHLRGWHVLLALRLLPALALGLAVSGRARHWLDRGWLRPAVYVYAAVAGVVVLVRGLLG